MRDGAALVQDEGSQLVALALTLAPVDGRDALAGPVRRAGRQGRAARRARRAERGARVTAVEPRPHRAELVARTAAACPSRSSAVDGRDAGLAAGGFDRVLVDAPCTGLGALRRRPEARWRRQPGDVPALARLQRELLARRSRLTRPGGVVAYVTCSPHLAETVGVVADALRRIR